MILMDWHIIKPKNIIIIIIIIIIIRINDMMKITGRTFVGFGVDTMETSLRLEACDHVEKMIDEMKATNLYTGEHSECFVIYMYMMGTNDSGADTAAEGSSIDTASEMEEFHWIDCIVWTGQLF